MIEYFAGCITIAAIWTLYHYGIIQPRLEALKQLAENKLGINKPPAPPAA